jgi:glycerate-2-kinase
MISDVIGDPLESIASGPTAPDSTTFTDAQNVLEKYRLNDQLPPSIRTYLNRGASGDFEETLKPDDPIFKKVHHIIIGNNLLSLEKAADKANQLNYHTLILTSRIQGEAREVAKVIGSITQELQSHNLPITRPACLLAGGETTVTLRGEGKGGRNQELALASLLSMKNSSQQYVIASCGTDGTDGPTDAAGGIVLPDMWKKIKQLNLNAQAYLDENNAYPFLEQIDGLIVTGPTGTNVMDIILILVP